MLQILHLNRWYIYLKNKFFTKLKTKFGPWSSADTNLSEFVEQLSFQSCFWELSLQAGPKANF